MAQSYRRATIKVTFQADLPRPRAFEVEQFIREDLRLRPQDVIGIHFSITGSIVYIKMTTEALCTEVAQRHGTGLKFKHSDGHIGAVTVEHVGFGLRTLRVFELPFEVPKETVTAAFEPYGKVVGHVAEKWQTFSTYQVLNGVRQIQIELTKHVPSYLMIGGVRAIVMYEGQPRTCAGCGQEGHVRSECMHRRLVQTPIGEEVSATAVTSLPITYAKVTQNQDTSIEVTPETTLPPSTAAESTEEACKAPPPVPSAEPETQQTVTNESVGAMDIDSGVVPTSAFLQTGMETDDGRPHSDSDQHTRKQKSPRKRKKRRLTPSDDVLQRTNTSDNDQTSDSDVPSSDQPHGTATPTVAQPIPNQNIHSLQSAQTDDRPHTALTGTSASSATEGQNYPMPSTSTSWAEDVDEGAEQTDNVAEQVHPMEASDSVRN